jgi:cell division protein FtsB
LRLPKDAPDSLHNKWAAQIVALDSIHRRIVSFFTEVEEFTLAVLVEKREEVRIAARKCLAEQDKLVQRRGILGAQQSAELDKLQKHQTALTTFAPINRTTSTSEEIGAWDQMRLEAQNAILVQRQKASHSVDLIVSNDNALRALNRQYEQIEAQAASLDEQIATLRLPPSERIRTQRSIRWMIGNEAYSVDAPK